METIERKTMETMQITVSVGGIKYTLECASHMTVKEILAFLTKECDAKIQDTDVTSMTHTKRCLLNESLTGMGIRAGDTVHVEVYPSVRLTAVAPKTPASEQTTKTENGSEGYDLTVMNFPKGLTTFEEQSAIQDLEQQGLILKSVRARGPQGLTSACFHRPKHFTPSETPASRVVGLARTTDSKEMAKTIISYQRIGLDLISILEQDGSFPRLYFAPRVLS